MILLFIVNVPAESRTRRLPFCMYDLSGKRIPDYSYDTTHHDAHFFSGGWGGGLGGRANAHSMSNLLLVTHFDSNKFFQLNMPFSCGTYTVCFLFQSRCLT